MDIKTSNLKRATHIEVLDGLRGIAIIMVLWFHVWQQSWVYSEIKLLGFKLNLDFIPVTGFLGVELFFFISAFCLFYPYARYMFEGAKFQTLKQFIYKRAIKILPSYFLAIFLIQIVINQDFGSFKNALWHNVTHILFINNLFRDTYGSINGVFWSLAVEVQFYVIFPLLCWLFRKKPLIIFAAMTLTSVIYRYYIQTYRHNDLHFLLNQLPGFLDMFACGMLAAYLFVFLKNKLKNIEKLKFFFTAFALIMISVLVLMLQWLYSVKSEIDGLQNWQAQNRFFLALVFLLLTLSSCFAFKFWKVVVANKLFRFMSVISYNLYIWHQLIALQFLKHKIPVPKTPDAHMDKKWQVQYTVISIISGIIFSALITYIYERPLLKKGIKKTFKDLYGFFHKLFKPKKSENIKIQ